MVAYQDKVYRTYAGWRKAIKKANPDFDIRWEGNKDICHAFSLPDDRALGEWDGGEGTVIETITVVMGC